MSSKNIKIKIKLIILYNKIKNYSLIIKYIIIYIYSNSSFYSFFLIKTTLKKYRNKLRKFEICIWSILKALIWIIIIIEIQEYEYHYMKPIPYS